MTTDVATKANTTRLSPKDAFQQYWLEKASGLAAPDFLQAFKQKGVESFAKQILPNNKSEHWKYLNLNPLWTSRFNLGAQNSKPVSQAHKAFSELDAIRVPVVNGDVKQTTQVQESEFSICTFSQANDEQQALIEQHLGNICTYAGTPQPFDDLNQALLEDGLLIEVKANQSITQPILIEHTINEDASNCLLATRVLIVVHANSKARVIESFHTENTQQNSLMNSVCEVYCAENSHLEHSRLQLSDESLMHLSGLHIALKKASQYHGFNLALGSEISRNNIFINHLEQASHCQLNGVYLPKNKQQVDFHTTLEHASAHCTSSETFRGIMNNQATATFNGRIHIHPDAQKTDARLSNKNLLLSPQATINTKPELEIYADDVVCAHGATVAQIDEEAIFYLMSRGVSRMQAEILLSFGFINELFAEITDKAVADELSTLISQRFEQDFIQA